MSDLSYSDGVLSDHQRGRLATIESQLRQMELHPPIADSEIPGEAHYEKEVVLIVGAENQLGRDMADLLLVQGARVIGFVEPAARNLFEAHISNTRYTTMEVNFGSADPSEMTRAAAALRTTLRKGRLTRIIYNLCEPKWELDEISLEEALCFDPTVSQQKFLRFLHAFLPLLEESGKEADDTGTIPGTSITITAGVAPLLEDRACEESLALVQSGIWAGFNGNVEYFAKETAIAQHRIRVNGIVPSPQLLGDPSGVINLDSAAVAAAAIEIGGPAFRYVTGALVPVGACQGVDVETILSPSMEGETVWVTGSASGLGREMAVLFTKLGATVCGFDRQPSSHSAEIDRGESTIKALEQRGNPGNYHHTICDLTVPEQVGGQVGQVVGKYGGPSRIFCNAGVVHRMNLAGATEDVLHDDIRNCYTAGVLPIVTLYQLLERSSVLPDQDRKRISVILTSSISGLMGGDESETPPTGHRSSPPYTAVKRMIIETVAAMARHPEMGKCFRFTSVAPTGVKTPMSARTNYTPIFRLGRQTSKADVACVMARFSSPAFAAVSGYTLPVAGAWYPGITGHGG